MTPDLYAVEYAHSVDEVVALLRHFVAEVRRGPVLALLPDALATIDVRAPEDVFVWRRRLAELALHPSGMNASARFWVDEIAELFLMAQRRLSALDLASPDAVPAMPMRVLREEPGPQQSLR